MNRRGFLKALLGAAAAPVVVMAAPALALPEISGKSLMLKLKAQINPLFNGDVGKYSGINLAAVRKYSEFLAADMRQRPRLNFEALMKGGA